MKTRYSEVEKWRDARRAEAAERREHGPSTRDEPRGSSTREEPWSRAQFVSAAVAQLEPELNPSGDPDVRAFLARWVRRRGLSVAIARINETGLDGERS